MCPRPRPAHAQEEQPQLRSEDVLSGVRWRAQVGERAGPRSVATEVLERRPALSFRRRIARAVRAPVVAGVAVFVVAVLVTIGVAVASSLGAQLPEAGLPDAGAAELTNAGGSSANGAGEAPASVANDTGTQGAPDAASGDNSADGADGADGAGHLGSGAGGVASLYVHVVGAVKRSGVVKLAPGSRVQDAIEAAGGASEQAVLAGVNLARVVVDGEQLLVPDAEALEAAAAGDPIGGTNGAAGLAASAGAGAATDGVNATSGAPQVINLNTADAALLETLPRVGPALAGRIIDWREQNDGFASIDQLLEVSGIGAKTLDGFRDLVGV